jgi:hypothetical protein
MIHPAPVLDVRLAAVAVHAARTCRADQAALIVLHVEGDSHQVETDATARAIAAAYTACPAPSPGLLAVTVVTSDGTVTPYYP